MDSAYAGAFVPGRERTVVGKCPICGQDVVQTGKVYSCSSNKSEKQEDGNWKQVAGCGYKLFGFAGKKLTARQAESLLSGKVVSLKGCTSKAGKKFDCKLRLSPDGRPIPEFSSARKGGK